ncbi:FAD-dependent monooxygenase [Hymenobacter terrenus]|uniref:FAD-dependent monooxygenase n=1 Tax=Hymenobacter terrenus TaxID=1629124 RepID=UPI0006192F90|nr:FAD-dependent monooxygenase [Hymenobacter terrenus]
MNSPGIIIGGGIGGLATALALHQRGIRTIVYERATAIREVGAGLVLAPNALRVCAQLGLSKAVEAVSWPLSRAVVATTDGRPLTMVDADALAKQFGYGMRVIHRSALQKLLLDALPAEAVQTNKKVIGITTGRLATQIAFADGSAVDGDFVIGADGINSAVRRAIFGAKALRYSGQTCWRAVVDCALPTAQPHQSVEYWGSTPGLRVGLVPMEAGQIYVFVTTAAPAEQLDTPGTVVATLLELTREFGPSVAEVLRACDEHQLSRADLFDLPTLPTWSARSVALLGDAAHATTPNLGQGACQALEDAYTIAACLAAHDAPAPAFAEYQRLRKAKADLTVQLSRQIGQVVNLPAWLKPLLFPVLRMIPPAISMKQISRVYDTQYLDKLRASTPSLPASS